MDKIIEFRDNNFGYNSINRFRNFSLEVYEGEIVSLVGPSGSGKTTLLKMLCNEIHSDCLYYLGNKFADCGVENLKRNIVVIKNISSTKDLVRNFLSLFMKRLNFSKSEIDNRVSQLVKDFNLDSYLNLSINELSYSKRVLVNILSYLIIKPKFVAIDSLFSSLTMKDKKEVIKYIKVNKITLLNVVNNLEDTLYGSKICVLDKFVNILSGNTLSVLKTDTLLKRLGFIIPLPIYLSIELGNYDLLDKIYTDQESLVKALWK